MESFKKVIRPGNVDIYERRRLGLGGVESVFASYPVFCKIVYRDGVNDVPGETCGPPAGMTRLSITGVVGPTAGGNSHGPCGVILDSLDRDELGRNLAPGWDAATLLRFFDHWRRWHLNDMRPGCEHQQADWDTSEKVEVVKYGLTTDAWTRRRRAEEAVVKAAADRVTLALGETDRALLQARLIDVFAPPDADSPLSGMYEVKSREVRSVGWVRPEEHPRGLLGKKCSECGYGYGTSWLHEPVPEDVLEFLKNLPDADEKPAWV